MKIILASLAAICSVVIAGPAYADKPPVPDPSPIQCLRYPCTPPVKGPVPTPSPIECFLYPCVKPVAGP